MNDAIGMIERKAGPSWARPNWPWYELDEANLGLDPTESTIEKVRARANPSLRILGVVITMHDRRTALARDIREQITQVFGNKVFRTTISKSVRLEESPAYKESIFTFAPDSTGASEYYMLCEEVMDRGETRLA